MNRRSLRFHLAGCAMALALSGFARANSPQASNEASDDPWASVDPTLVANNTTAPESVAKSAELPRRKSERNKTGVADSAAPASAGWARTGTALAGELGLIGKLAWGYRVVGAKAGMLTPRGRNAAVEVLSRTALSAKQSLCLVRVGSRVLLLGVGADRVAALDVIQDEAEAARLVGFIQRPARDKDAADFNRCLEQEAGAYATDAPPIVETPADEGQTPRVRTAVEEALARFREAHARRRAS